MCNEDVCGWIFCIKCGYIDEMVCNLKLFIFLYEKNYYEDL